MPKIRGAKNFFGVVNIVIRGVKTNIWGYHTLHPAEIPSMDMQGAVYIRDLYIFVVQMPSVTSCPKSLIIPNVFQIYTLSEWFG